MDILSNFVEKDMLEQIRILEQVTTANDVHAVAPLLDLYESHGCDQAVEGVIYQTLQQLMKGDDNAVMLGLSHPSVDIQLLAIRCGGEAGSEKFQAYLLEKLQETTDPVMLAAIIRSMGQFTDPELITVLLPYMHHEDSSVAASCLELLASLGGKEARDSLIDLVEREIVNLDCQGGCSFVAGLGMACLSQFADEKTLQFLIKHIHHVSPAFRRLVGETLIRMGSDALPALIRCVQLGSIDEKIMAINCLGFIRHRKGAELLIAELGEAYAEDANVRFALYEAVGRVDCLRSALCLSAALFLEQDEFVINAVLTGLERICHPGLAKVFLDHVSDKNWARAMVRKLLSLRAKNMLQMIYDIPEYRSLLLEEVCARGDKGLQQFCVLLFEDKVTPLLPEELRCFNGQPAQSLPFSGKKMVVADDSLAIIRFYCEVASEVGFDVVSVQDGQEAMVFFQQEKFPETIDLLLTDMNMPNKDGVELVTELRQIEGYKNLPVLMATTESELSQREAALRAGVSQFISKPFSREVLLAKLQEMLLG